MYLRGIGYAYLSGFFAISVFFMCLLPTPCAPSSTKVFLWNAGSDTIDYINTVNLFPPDS